MPGASKNGSRSLVAFSGLLGGFAGIAGFLPDAVFTTLVIMREIARIAREEGEDLTTEEGRASCVRVFSLGTGDEAGYLSARFMLQGTAARAMLSGVAARWGVMLGEKFAAQAVPLAGAAAAVTLNTAFLEHYRRLARAHFTVRRIERAFGRERVRAAAGIVENPARMRRSWRHNRPREGEWTLDHPGPLSEPQPSPIDLPNPDLSCRRPIRQARTCRNFQSPSKRQQCKNPNLMTGGLGDRHGPPNTFLV